MFRLEAGRKTYNSELATVEIVISQWKLLQHLSQYGCQKLEESYSGKKTHISAFDAVSMDVSMRGV